MKFDNDNDNKENEKKENKNNNNESVISFFILFNHYKIS